MKTDASKKVAVIDQPDKQIDNQQEIGMRRRTLQTLQKAAGDKENLVGGGKMPVTGKDEPKITKKAPSPSVKIGLIEKRKQVKPSTHYKKKVITVEDLTSEAGPSEHYWETLAERRRVALEKALEENQMLYERVALLEEENENCKNLLEESKALVDTLSEILKETQGENLDSSFDNDEPSIIHADERPTN